MEAKQYWEARGFGRAWAVWNEHPLRWWYPPVGLSVLRVEPSEQEAAHIIKAMPW